MNKKYLIPFIIVNVSIVLVVVVGLVLGHQGSKQLEVITQRPMEFQGGKLETGKVETHWSLFSSSAEIHDSRLTIQDLLLDIPIMHVSISGNLVKLEIPSAKTPAEYLGDFSLDLQNTQAETTLMLNQDQQAPLNLETHTKFGTLENETIQVAFSGLHMVAQENYDGYRARTVLGVEESLFKPTNPGQQHRLLKARQVQMEVSLVPTQERLRGTSLFKWEQLEFIDESPHKVHKILPLTASSVFSTTEHSLTETRKFFQNWQQDPAELLELFIKTDLRLEEFDYSLQGIDIQESDGHLTIGLIKGNAVADYSKDPVPSTMNNTVSNIQLLQGQRELFKTDLIELKMQSTTSLQAIKELQEMSAQSILQQDQPEHFKKMIKQISSLYTEGDFNMVWSFKGLELLAKDWQKPLQAHEATLTMDFDTKDNLLDSLVKLEWDIEGLQAIGQVKAFNLPLNRLQGQLRFGLERWNTEAFDAVQEAFIAEVGPTPAQQRLILNNIMQSQPKISFSANLNNNDQFEIDATVSSKLLGQIDEEFDVEALLKRTGPKGQQATKIFIESHMDLLLEVIINNPNNFVRYLSEAMPMQGPLIIAQISPFFNDDGKQMKASLQLKQGEFLHNGKRNPMLEMLFRTLGGSQL